LSHKLSQTDALSNTLKKSGTT